VVGLARRVSAGCLTGVLDGRLDHLSVLSLPSGHLARRAVEEEVEEGSLAALQLFSLDRTWWAI